MPTVSKTSHRCFHSIPQIKNLFSGCLVKIHVEKHLYVDFTFGLYLSWELVKLVPMQICKLEVEPTTLDYSVWYSNLTEKTKKKIKIMQKKMHKILPKTGRNSSHMSRGFQIHKLVIYHQKSESMYKDYYN